MENDVAKVYLLFEWTEERESKIHIGVYSTFEKAQAASQLSWMQELTDRGAEPDQIGPVVWASKTNAVGQTYHWGRKTLSSTVAAGSEEAENILYSDDDETPYEIEEFEFDVFWQRGEQKPGSYEYEVKRVVV